MSNAVYINFWTSKAIMAKASAANKRNAGSIPRTVFRIHQLTNPVG